MSADGSYSNGDAGWGFTVAPQDGLLTSDFYGPVVVSEGEGFIGAEHASNNTGELCAMLFALAWIARHIHAPALVVLEYDSEYAADIACLRSRPTCNLALGMRLRTMAARCGSRIQWRKARAHTGLTLNDHADALAKFGATGMTNVLVSDFSPDDPDYAE